MGLTQLLQSQRRSIFPILLNCLLHDPNIFKEDPPYYWLPRYIMLTTMVCNADKRRRRRNRRNDRPVHTQRPPPLDDIFRAILPRYDEEFQLMLKDPHQPLDRDRLECVARERIAELRAVYSTRLQEVHEKWNHLGRAIRSSAISVGELASEHKHYSMDTREEQRLFEEYVLLQNLLPPLNVERMISVRADVVDLIGATMEAMGNLNSCPNEIEIENLIAQINEVERVRGRRLDLKERFAKLNERKMDIAIRMVEVMAALKDADERLECGEEDILDCRGAVEDLRRARMEAERTNRDLDSAVADLREINPTADIDLGKL